MLSESYAVNFISKQKRNKLTVSLNRLQIDIGNATLNVFLAVQVQEKKKKLVKVVIDQLFIADIVYAVVYSLLLLNTDLHVAQGSHARMTRSEFIRNTMSTVRDQRDHEGHTGYKNKAAINNRNWESELEQNLKVKSIYSMLVFLTDLLQ